MVVCIVGAVASGRSPWGILLTLVGLGVLVGAWVLFLKETGWTNAPELAGLTDKQGVEFYGVATK